MNISDTVDQLKKLIATKRAILPPKNKREAEPLIQKVIKKALQRRQGLYVIYIPYTGCSK